jgi:hypothetical protein
VIRFWGRPHYSLRKGRGLEKQKENRIFAPAGRKAKFIRYESIPDKIRSCKSCKNIFPE